ncbi:ATP-dependent DNA helicase RecG [Clostridium putrefaciens]|uniref:ATP-dependent DNA helicase RecG n=1 Tax=Clostridium putrefaciens TaxID=99675 RepID=A0A381J8F9_9CLOT|nr:ATP-dependent DNA helicase RecG [Clostridium putrefaciens]SUY47289.1 ATP-dependent DNA helicase RecG [Clostridium putrefaciens]
MNLYKDIEELKGVGGKTKENLNKCGIFTVMDLLLYFPKTYEFVNNETLWDESFEKEKLVLTCTFKGIKSHIKTRTGKHLITLNFSYKNMRVVAKWFNQPYIKTKFNIDEEYVLLGDYKKSGEILEITNPVIGSKELKTGNIISKYMLQDKLTNKIILKLINGVLDNIEIKENLPQDLLQKHNFMSLDSSIRNIHFPKDMKSLNKSKERLKFQELFTYSLKILMLKKKLQFNTKGIAFKMDESLADLKESLPFKLTKAQSRTVRAILIDEKKPYPMNRLVQGDVGSGKTIIAIIAMFNVVKNNYQAIFMAPTEILANQHYKECKDILSKFGIEIELLTGSTSPKEKERIKKDLRDGKSIIVIGTHALIEEDVKALNLGIIITDEQHRFGVHQRSKLINKEETADILVMTATPIPRTLSLYLYGDLDVSIIDELPPGRQKIDTVFYNKKQREIAYKFLFEEIKKGRQAYIVCPLIEENEDLDLNSVNKLYEELKQTYPSKETVEILHGKMKSSMKQDIMNRFKNGEISVLISTTVIEVGVNVPNATVMIVENAERFGLSQLHQLRGRVGRGTHKSYCILTGQAKSNTTKKRMMTMVESNDGFYIAEQDLKLRGSGELFGIKQHGETGLILADIMDDIELFKIANNEAIQVINSNLQINKLLIEEIMSYLESSSKYICFN